MIGSVDSATMNLLLCRGLHELHVWAETELRSSVVAATENLDGHLMMGYM